MKIFGFSVLAFIVGAYTSSQFMKFPIEKAKRDLAEVKHDAERHDKQLSKELTRCQNEIEIRKVEPNVAEQAE